MQKNRIPQWKQWIATPIATALGTGFSPKAPGTAGSVIGLILVYLLKDASILIYGLVWLALFGVGWWSALIWSQVHQAKDSQAIVIDEVLGYLIAMATLPVTPTILLVQFAVFRFFDALKPSPIRELDRWGKQFEIGPLQSLGVILDDLLAGLLTLLFFLALKTLVISTGLIDSSLFSPS